MKGWRLVEGPVQHVIRKNRTHSLSYITKWYGEPVKTDCRKISVDRIVLIAPKGGTVVIPYRINGNIQDWKVSTNEKRKG